MDGEIVVSPPRKQPELFRLIEQANFDCIFTLPNGEQHTFGQGTPRFHIRLHSDKVLKHGLDELALAESFIDGGFDIEGDMYAVLDLRQHLSDRTPMSIALRFFYDLYVRATTKVNKRSISQHYDIDDDFYLFLVDKKYRFYSQCQFTDDNDTLEQAAERKFMTMFHSLRLKPGMRLLDIGCGWGGVVEHCGERGIHVTSLTIAEKSREYASDIIKERKLDHCEIRLEDFFEHKSREPYDAVVIYGVIEHIPHYKRFTQRIWDLLKPAGRIYFDASATHEKFYISNFSRRYIWPGDHAFLCLQNLVQELLYNGFALKWIKDETRDYALTMEHWAKRFDARADEIRRRWGEKTFRAFQIYLWAGAHNFFHNDMQAYQVVAERTAGPGPRPGTLRQLGHFFRGFF